MAEGGINDEVRGSALRGEPELRKNQLPEMRVSWDAQRQAIADRIRTMFGVRAPTGIPKDAPELTTKEQVDLKKGLLDQGVIPPTEVPQPPTPPAGTQGK